MSTIVVNISSVGGEANETGYSGWIRCHGIAHGVDLPVTHAGTTRTEGMSVHGSICLTHKIDKATPLLRLKTLEGTALGRVDIKRLSMIGGTLTEVEHIALGANTKVHRIELTTPMNADGSGPADERPDERFWLDYDEIMWTSNHHVDDVSQGQSSASYNVATRSENVSMDD